MIKFWLLKYSTVRILALERTKFSQGKILWKDIINENKLLARADGEIII